MGFRVWGLGFRAAAATFEHLDDILTSQERTLLVLALMHIPNLRPGPECNQEGHLPTSSAAMLPKVDHCYSILKFCLFII